MEEVTKLLIAAEGKTFRELDETGRGDSAGNKGSLGNIIEESVLHYPVNSDAEADILVGDTRYELKVTPLKHSGKGKRTKTVAKERLVLDIINYENLPKENFEDSRFWNKSKNIIMVYYYDDREDKKTQSRLDCKVLKSVVLHYDETIWRRFEMIGRRFTRKLPRGMQISFRNRTQTILPRARRVRMLPV